MRLFKPAVEMTLGGVSAKNTDGTGLRMTFRVTKTATPTPDSAEVQIYNLAPERRAALGVSFAELGRSTLVIRTGYDGSISQLFSGDVRAPLEPSVTNGVDIITRARADDGGDAIADVLLPGLSTAFLTPDNMVQAALAAFALPPPQGAAVVVTRDSSVDRAIASIVPVGFPGVSIGKATELLDEAARILKTRWWIHDGVLYMAKLGVPIDGLAVQLPRAHWLSEPQYDANGVVRIKTFLNPLLRPGRQVILSPGRGQQEVYRVESSTYAGDTESVQPWEADLALNRVQL